MRLFCIVWLNLLFAVSVFGQEDKYTSYYLLLLKNENLELMDRIPEETRNPELLFILGNAYQNEYDYIEAVQCYRSALQYDSTFTKAKEALAGLYTSMGKHNNALPLYKELYSGDTASIKYIFRLAGCYQVTGNYQDAIKTVEAGMGELIYDNYHALKVLGDCFQLSGNLDSAYYYYNKADKMDRGSTLMKLYMSRILYKQEKYPEALVLAGRAADLDSSDMALRKQLGYCYYKTEKFGRAISHLRYAYDRGDTSAVMSGFLGISCYNIKEYEQAADYLRQSVRQDSLNRETLFYTGITFAILERHLEAIDYFYKVMELLVPDNRTLFIVNNEIGLSYLKIEQYNNAVRYLETAYHLDKNDNKLMYNLAMALMNLGDVKNLKKAKSLFETSRSRILNNENIRDPNERLLPNVMDFCISKIEEELFMLDVK